VLRTHAHPTSNISLPINPPAVAMDSVNQFMDSYPSLCQSKRFQSLEASTGYKAAHMFLAAFATLFTVLFFIGGSKLVSDLFGFVYPAYMR